MLRTLSSTAETLSELRSLLHRPPCPLVWAELCAQLERHAGEHAAREQLMPYVEDMLRAWPDRLRTTPPTWLRATLRGERNPLLRIARHLHHVGPLGEKGLLAVITCPDLGPITHLTIQDADLYDGIGMLTRHITWPGLATLDLSHNHISHQAAQQLARAPFAQSVTRVILRGCELARPGAQALARGTLLTNACIVDLGDNELHVGELSALLPRLTSAQHLTLCDNPLRDSGARKLASALPDLPALRTLDLARCELTEASVALLVAAARPRAVRLDLSPHDEPSEPSSMDDAT
jgi:hypothetical protein